MIVKRVCKKCGCIDWINLSDRLYCCACETSDCAAHRIWMPLEDKDIKIVNIGGRNLRFYRGDLNE